MQILRMEVGALGTNCYIIWCETTNKAAVIDPGGDAAAIIAQIRDKQLTVEYIINTHGHGDHIGAVNKVKHATNAVVLIHAADADMLTSSSKNLSMYMGPGFTCEPADRTVREGDVISFGSVSLTILETPRTYRRRNMSCRRWCGLQRRYSLCGVYWSYRFPRRFLQSVN